MNHGVTYEEALQRCHIATTIEEIQSDAEDKGRAGINEYFFRR